MSKKISFIAIAAVTWVCSFSSSFAAPNSNEDTLDVCANVAEGEEWVNEIGAGNFRIKAVGRWSEGEAEHSASGTPRVVDYPEKLIARGLKTGALVMERENGTFEAIGRGAKKYIEDGESVKFVINDYYDSYGDNRGCLTVTIIPLDNP